MNPRLAVLFALAVATLGAAPGCPRAESELAGTDEDDGAGAAPSQDCQVDADCAPAGSSCCECPSYALPVADAWQDSCDEVDCDGAETGQCPLTEAVCEAGACVLQCQAAACEMTCAGGFSADAFGCLVCACADPSPPGDYQCTVDDDCVQVAADCCGCARGGEDTAVPVADVGAFEGALDCTDDAICPGVDVCDSSLVARCVGGVCALAAEPGTGFGADAGPDENPTDPQYCGDSALPACPDELVCVLNDPAHRDATAAGLGVCLAR